MKLGRIIPICLICFAFAQICEAQRSSFSGSASQGEGPGYSEIQGFGFDEYENPRNARPARIALRGSWSDNSSVLESRSLPPAPVNTLYDPPVSERAERINFAQPRTLAPTTSYWDAHHRYQPDHRGFYPFVTGDIFGVSRQECCDEWQGHCECLELTSRQSKCECNGSYAGRTSKCYSCSPAGSYAAPSTASRPSRTVRRQTVSEYFHPQR